MEIRKRESRANQIAYASVRTNYERGITFQRVEPFFSILPRADRIRVRFQEAARVKEILSHFFRFFFFEFPASNTVRPYFPNVKRIKKILQSL